MGEARTAGAAAGQASEATLRVGLMGASARTGLARSLQEGFAGSGVQFDCLASVSGDAYRHALRQADLVQITSFDTTRYWALPALRARLMGKPVVRYWVGTDVLNMQKDRRERRRARLADRIVTANVVQWSNLQDELAEMNVASEVLPAPHRGIVAAPVPQLPPKLTALTYLSVRPWKWDLYGGEVILRLAREHPEWKFLVVNHDGSGLGAPENIECVGRVRPQEMDALYRRASVLVRMTTHDGLPRMILEAMARGLHVVWSQDFPHAYQAGGYEQAERALQEIAARNEVNTAGREYILQAFAPATVAARWRALYEELCGR
ncbi:MAG: glycosyltransferase [Planctomycetota bacterium]